MARYNPFSIEALCRRWTGAWELADREVAVSSAWGSARAPLGRSRPEIVAGRLLREIVEGRATRH